MPPQLIRDDRQDVTGYGGRIFRMKVKRSYLGVVAHECHISAISRQLVVIGLFFSLWGGGNKSVTTQVQVMLSSGRARAPYY